MNGPEYSGNSDILEITLFSDTLLIGSALSPKRLVLIHCAKVSKKLCRSPVISANSFSIATVVSINNSLNAADAKDNETLVESYPEFSKFELTKRVSPFSSKYIFDIKSPQFIYIRIILICHIY